MREITEVYELRAIQLNILEKVARYCGEHGIDYYLDGGTLLGAARHQGYIPWDDDIDIVMFRDDYEKFCRSFNENQTDGLSVKCIKNEKDWHFPYAKIEDARTRIIEACNHDINLGINIDLFVLDNVPDSKAKMLLQYIHCKLYRDLLRTKLIKEDANRPIWKNYILRIGKIIAAPFSYNFLVKRIHSIATKYDYETTQRIACVTTMIYGMREIQRKSWYEKATKIEFEDKKFKAPVGYEQVLERLYGDYMKLPPKDKQVAHHSFRAYWR